MSSISATDFRNHLFKYLKKIVECNDILKISTKKGNVIVISESDYNNIIENLDIINNKNALNDINDALDNMDNPDYWINESEVDFDEL